MANTATKFNPVEEWKGKKVVLFAVPGAFTVRVHALCITVHLH